MGGLKAPSEDELLLFIEREEQRLVGRTFRVPRENISEFRVIFGVCAQALRYSGGYAVMVRAGRPREAIALARQAMEHAATAMWAHFVDGGVSRLQTTLKATHLTFLSKMSDYLDDDALHREIEKQTACLEHGGKGLPPVAHRLAVIDQGRMLQTIYMQQSQLVHVTGSAVLGFVAAGADGELALNWDPADPHQANTTYAAAMAAMFASWVIACVGGDSAALAELDQLSDKLQLPLYADPSNATS